MLRQLAFSPPFPQLPALVWAFLQVVAVIHAYGHPTARVHPILLHHPKSHSWEIIASIPSFSLHSPLIVSSYISVVYIGALYMELKILLLLSLDPLQPDWVL